MTNDYAMSAVELLKKGTDVDIVLNNLKRVLETHGHLKLFPAILKETVAMLESRAKHSAPLLYVRKESDVVEYKKHIEEALNSLKTDTRPNVVTDDSLVGGFVVEYKNSRIDRSYKHSLLKMYQKMTH